MVPRHAHTVAVVVFAILLANSRASAGSPKHAGEEVVRGRRAAAGEVLIRFRQSEPSTILDHDIDRDERVGAGRWRLVHSRARSAAALVEAFRARADVVDVEPNYRVTIDGAPNDLSSALWALENTGQTLPGGVHGTPGADIGAVRAWDTTTGSRQVVVATIDTGVMASHVDLAANVWSAPAAFSVTIGGAMIPCAAGTHGFNAITRTCDPADDHGHGTHVAGSIGAVGGNGIGVVGVNWTTSIMALKFLDATGNGYISDAIDAIEFAIQVKRVFASTGAANVRVLNNSWGGGGFSQAFADEIQRAGDADMLFVAAAGNASADLGATPEFPASYAGGNVIAVGATDYNDQLAAYSGRGLNTVHIAAPGTAIYSTAISPSDPSASVYTTMTGTSMATAYVSGAAALVLSHCSYVTGALRNALLTTAATLPSLDGRIQSGRRLNAAAAVESCNGPEPSASDIVLYAADVPAAGRHGSWMAVPEPTAAGGMMLANVDAGVALDWAQSAPASYIEAAFSAPAGVPYHIWVRMRAANNQIWNDSFWLQLSDAYIGSRWAYAINSTDALWITLENCAQCGVSGWGWQDRSFWLTGIDVTFGSSGLHTLRIQPREDGVQIDQIVLSQSPYRASPPGQVMNDATIVPKSGASPPAVRVARPYGGQPAVIPGTVQAVNFDEGGEGVGYHDDSAGNEGGAYRQTDVDIEPTGDRTGFDVGWVSAREWLQYSVDVQAAGKYTATFSVASYGQGGTFHLEMNGTNVTGLLTVPNTGGWQAWQTVTATIALSAGPQTARLVMDTAGVYAVGNFGPMMFTAVPANGGLAPYRGTPVAIPGRVEAAEFDEGGEGIAYHDDDLENWGGAFRSTGVDLAASSEGGYTIGWIGAREWVNYTVDVARAGTYTVQLRVASPDGGGSLHIGFNGSPGSWTPVAIPATGGWQTWTTVTVPLTLSPGRQQITLFFDTRGYNVSYLIVQ